MTAIADAADVAWRSLAWCSDSVVLIDGRSGAGKTTFARHVAARARSEGVLVLVVSLDTIYPGWGGLEEASRMVPALIRERVFPVWDWGRACACAHVALPRVPLIVEGCGAVSRESVALAQASVWIDGDAVQRRERAVGRDGASLAEHWDMWARQEDAHVARHAPDTLANVCVSGFCSRSR